jgi:hypothetical protein
MRMEFVGADRGYEGCEDDWPDTPLFAAFGSSYRTTARLKKPGSVEGLPANQTPRFISNTASSFLANKFAPTVECDPVGARLARESGASVYQQYRVIVPREQVRSYS